MIQKYKIIIPARYSSSRFPGKPLAKICGVEMIKRVWNKCIQVLDPADVFVATDSDRIMQYCISSDINAIATSSECKTGTDRVYEASMHLDADVYINVQGDEPLVDPDDIIKVIDKSKSNPGEIINAMCPIRSEDEFYNSSVPKVVSSADNQLLYMSRSAIPATKELGFVRAHKQVCIYAFPRDALRSFYNVDNKTPLESIEDIEILRFIELGYKVYMVNVSEASVAVDHPEDIVKVENLLRQDCK